MTALEREISDLKPQVQWGMKIDSKRYLPLAEKLKRLETIQGKVHRSERLTNGERLELQGIVFNHDGKCGKIVT